MTDLLLPGIILVNAAFALLAFFVERSGAWRRKASYYLAFVLVNSVMVVYGAQNGLLFAGRARAEQWVSGLLLPFTAFFLAIGSGLYLISSLLARTPCSYWPFLFAFLLSGVLATFLTVVVLVIVLL